ncbi:hypothetical protein E2C01_070353 [Portunus trituberculatus]|uniref:Uncharacterized protein n=1 Tax=Portunus trituberculatus TaxID=210409 RepID=A0A5B7HX24_PORTR|nr:hypothetical protein [Portunus trituberculatus]
MRASSTSMFWNLVRYAWGSFTLQRC